MLLDRRSLLRAASAMALGALLQPPARALARVSGGFIDHPFKLGVASGDPQADGFVIWTRLAPDPLNGGGMPGEPYEVGWQVATDERMSSIVQRGATLAVPENAHAVHVNVTGLEPDRPYWYRFTAGGEASETGRTRTFPVAGAPKDRLRFAFASCQHFAQGYFTAYRHMLRDDLDLIIHLGDYIYESYWGPKVRFHLPEPFSLEQYRAHHALYKSDAALRAAHAACPWMVTWDDHEVDNDYANAASEQNDDPQEFLRRRAAAYKAYYEHMPLRASARPSGPNMRLFEGLTVGNLAEFSLLDNRQYRDDQACSGPRFGGQVITNCAERTDPKRTILGADQERWLGGRLRHAKSTWKVLAQQSLMAQFRQSETEPDTFWSEGWDGYPAARERILKEIADRRIENVVSIGGDVHQFWVTDLKADFNDPNSATLATEFVGTSVTSSADGWAEPHLARNPHVKFHEWRQRGYARCEVTPSLWKTDFQAVNHLDPKGEAKTLASFVVEPGKPGAVKA